MRITIPAAVFHKAALKKRGAQGDEAEGSRKRPRPQSPSASQTVSRPPTPPFLPQHSPAPPPPPRRSPTPLPTPRSPAPMPPRSPVPVPPSEPVGPAVNSPPEGSTGPGSPLAGDSCPPTMEEVPEPSRQTPVDVRQKAVARDDVRAVGPVPRGDKMSPVSSRPSIMNHPRFAERLLSAASSPAIHEEMRRTNSRALYREGQTALLRAVNTFGHALTRLADMEHRVDRYRREALACRDRATKAEDALKLAQAGEEDRLEIIRSHARAEASAARQQIHKLTERAFGAEGKLMAADAELSDVKARLEEAKLELKSFEEKVEIAEEVARLADIKAAEAAEAMKMADRKIAGAAEAVSTANKKSAEAEAAALKAVDSYRSSPAFMEEVADAGADAYLQGFYCGRNKAARVSGIESLKELEPEEGDVADEVAPADDAAPLLAPAATED